ncbi:MAG: hypothetical protein U0228_35725 [Myxococcaceae bacterium]
MTLHRSIRWSLVGALVLASAALAWNHEYSWYDPAAPLTLVKPGADGVFGTGSKYEGGVKCSDCHTPQARNTANPLRALITFTPALQNQVAFDGGVDGFVFNAGQYALNTTYTVNVRMLNEHHLETDGGIKNNNFAAVFEDANGTRVGTLTTDTNISTGNCPMNSPSNMPPTTGTTHMYRRCDVVFSRYPNPSIKAWQFTWKSPATDAGVITMAIGMVDGNGNDRTRGLDGGADDDVVMGKLLLSP